MSSAFIMQITIAGISGARIIRIECLSSIPGTLLISKGTNLLLISFSDKPL